MFVVYAIKSFPKGRIYFGQTKDLHRRLKLHNGGKVRSTKTDGPWEIVAAETFTSRSEAMWTERRLKKSHEFQTIWLQNRVKGKSKMVSDPEGLSPRRG